MVVKELRPCDCNNQLYYGLTLDELNIILITDCTDGGRNAGQPTSPPRGTGSIADPNDLNTIYLMTTQGSINCEGVLTVSKVLVLVLGAHIYGSQILSITGNG